MGALGISYYFTHDDQIILQQCYLSLAVISTDGFREFQMRSRSLFSMLSLLLLYGAGLSNPTPRQGWPYTLPHPYSWDILRLQDTATFTTTTGEKRLAFSSPYAVAVTDLNGQVQPGWPVEDTYWINGPTVGITDADREPSLFLVRGNLTQRHHEIVKLNLDGTEDHRFSFSFDTPVDSDHNLGLTPVVLADLDQDGLMEALFYADTLLYAANGDGTVVPGFPWEIGGRANGELAPAVIQMEDAAPPVVLYAGEHELHARHVGANVELPGWPVPNLPMFPNHVAGLVVIPQPDDSGWCACFATGQWVYAIQMDGTIRSGFPVQTHQDGNESTYFLTAADIDGDHSPELIYKEHSTLLHVLDLKGNYLPGFPLSIGTSGTGESIAVLGKPGHNATMLFPAQTNSTYELDVYAIQDSVTLPGFPLHYEDDARIHAASKLLAWVEPDTIHLIVHSGHRSVMVWDWAQNTDSMVLEWPMATGNSQNNHVYRPRAWHDLPQPELHSFYRLFPPDDETVDVDEGLTFVWQGQPGREQIPVTYTLELHSDTLDSSFQTTDTSMTLEPDLFLDFQEEDTLAWRVTATAQSIILNCVNGWGHLTLAASSGVSPRSEMAPATLRIQNVYPNPFNHQTSIQFELPSSASVTLDMYDISGRLVHRLLHATLPRGEHRVKASAAMTGGGELASGVYFIRVHADIEDGPPESRFTKVLLVK